MSKGIFGIPPAAGKKTSADPFFGRLAYYTMPYQANKTGELLLVLITNITP
jgi:hypothetical protein